MDMTISSSRDSVVSARNLLLSEQFNLCGDQHASLTVTGKASVLKFLPLYMLACSRPQTSNCTMLKGVLLHADTAISH